MRRHLFWYLGGGALVVGLSALVAPDARYGTVSSAIAGLLGSAAVLYGIRLHRPPRPLFWRIIAAALGFGGVAAVVIPVSGAAVSARVYQVVDLLYLPAYLTFVLGALVLVRRLGPLRIAGLDAAIGGLTVTAFLWSLVLKPNIAISGIQGVLGATFPLCDVLVLMLVLRVVFSPLWRVPAVQFIAAGSGLLVVMDILFFSPYLASSVLSGRFLNAGYTTAYVLLAAAALHPSMRGVPAASTSADARPRTRRTLVVLGCAPLSTPLALLASRWVSGDSHVEAIAFIGIATVVLALVRIGLLLREADELRQRAEASEQRFRMVFDAAGHGMSIGANGMMTETNAALQRLLGYTGDELSQLHYAETTHPDDRELSLQASDDVMSGRQPSHTFEKRLVRKDGTAVWVAVTLTRAHDGSFGISLIDDMTTRKGLEEELRQAQKMEAVGKLAGGIAHDFNNVMTAVSGCADLLLEEIDVGDPRRRRVEVISQSAGRATDLTRQLLAFSRRQVLRLEPVDLADAVAGIAPMLEQLLPPNIEFVCDLEDGAVTRVDRAQLEQVLLNLALNARDAMGQGGKLRIGVRASGLAAELSVSDEGEGMDEATRTRIFEPFFTTKQSGTGLGLSMVDGVVGQSGGTLSVESTLGRGSVFTIRLPRVYEAAVERQPDQETPPPAATGRILLADDEDLVRRVTTEMLRRAGYEVVAVASGEEALGVLSGDDGGFDVLISDVAMTGMDGPALSRRAREIDEALPVLFISGYPAEVLTGDRMITDADDVLTKPFTAGELADRVELARGRASKVALV